MDECCFAGGDTPIPDQKMQQALPDDKQQVGELAPAPMPDYFGLMNELSAVNKLTENLPKEIDLSSIKSELEASNHADDILDKDKSLFSPRQDLEQEDSLFQPTSEEKKFNQCVQVMSQQICPIAKPIAAVVPLH